MGAQVFIKIKYIAVARVSNMLRAPLSVQSDDGLKCRGGGARPKRPPPPVAPLKGIGFILYAEH